MGKKNKYTKTADEFDFSAFNTEDSMFNLEDGYMTGGLGGYYNFEGFEQSFNNVHADSDLKYKNDIFYLAVDKKLYKEFKKRLSHNLSCMDKLKEIDSIKDGLWVSANRECSKYYIELHIEYRPYEILKLSNNKELDHYIKELDRLNIEYNSTLELVDGIRKITNRVPKAFIMDRLIGTQILIRDYSIINYLG